MTMASKLQIGVVRGSLKSVSMNQYADQIVENIYRYITDVSITEMSPSSPRWLKDGAPIKKITNYAYSYLFYPWRIRNLQADIFHITDHSHAHLMMGVDARRTIVTCHDLMGLVHPENIRSTAQLPVVSEGAYRYSIGFLQRAARVIADSENTKRDLLRLTQCQSDQVHVIYLGLSPVFQVCTNALDVQTFKREHGMEHSLLMLHVGSNVPYKNIPALFETLDILNRKLGLEVKLVKVGLPFTGEQEHLIRQRGLGSYIIHLGRLSPTDLVLAYQSCDIMLFPSSYEGFGWPPLEAMACGLPVVASGSGSLAEMVGDAALIISPNDYAAMAQTVATVLSNDQLRQELIDKGLTRARQFTWKKSVLELVDVYRQVAMELQSRLA